MHLTSYSDHDSLQKKRDIPFGLSAMGQFEGVPILSPSSTESAQVWHDNFIDAFTRVL